MRGGAAWLVAGAVLAGCGRSPPPETPVPSAAVRTVPVVRDGLTQTLVAYGATEFDPATLRSLSVQFEAQLVSLAVASGQRVAQGQALMELAPSAGARLELGRLRREATQAQHEAARVARLRDQGLATASEAAAAQVAADNALQARDSLADAAGGGHLRLRAPIDGIVDSVDFAPGDVVASGSRVLRLAPAGRLRVRLGLEPEDVPSVRAGQPVLLQALHPGPLVEGRVLAVDARVDAQTRLGAAFVEVPAAGGFLSGETLRGRIVLERHPDALVVPVDAIGGDAGAAFVYVIDGGHAHRRPVKPGWSEGASVEILAGLQAGEQVVVTGTSVLDDGMAVRVTP